MILRKEFKTSTLAFFGAAALAVWSTLQHLLDRTGHSNDIADFALRVLFGVGAGLMMLVAWRSGRSRRANRTTRS